MDKHPLINVILAIILIIFIIMFGIWVLQKMVSIVGNALEEMRDYLKDFVNNTDKLIVGVVISSIIAKIIEYRFNVKKYLFDKREQPYEQFITMVYKVMEETKKNEEDKISEEDMISMVSEFSKGLTLWGSNRVVKKWLKYRRESINSGGTETLILMEDIIYEIRKDIGLGRRLKKGDMLSFFINDIEKLIKK
ncbi:hypothetical protein SDC9_151422 [bioreactor metagenome]|uniref:Uncharacterized protein n=1 Tax=bioreactor metagenome TaxID=1076179 RepID=A0A645ERV9_9ZZZZ